MFLSGQRAPFSAMFASRAFHNLIETLYRENTSFRDRDLKRVTQCLIASKFSDAEILHNIRVSI